MASRVHLRFECWSDFVAAARCKPVWSGRPEHSRGTDDPKWYGTESFEQAAGFALDGWPQGRAGMVSTMASANVSAPASHRSESLDYGGCYPMIPVAIAGDPACMVNFGDQSIACKPIVRLACAASVPSGVSAGAFMAHGAALLSIVDNLESAGYSVELALVFGTRSESRAAPCFEAMAVFKRAGDPLDLDRAAFALANASVQRRFSFSLREQHEELRHLKAMSYGYSCSDPESLAILEPGQIFIPAADEESTVASALEKIGKVLAGQGVRSDWADLVEKALQGRGRS